MAPVSPQMAPPAIANAQILDYVERTPNAAISLVTALAAAQPSPPLNPINKLTDPASRLFAGGGWPCRVQTHEE